MVCAARRLLADGHIASFLFVLLNKISRVQFILARREFLLVIASHRVG